MKAKELITKVLVGNPKTIVSVFAMMFLIFSIQGIGYGAAPEFDEGLTATRSIPENTPVGVSITETVGATDDDDDNLTYAIVDSDNDPQIGDESFFSIESTSGRLKVAKALDYEMPGDTLTTGNNTAADNAYTVQVTVSDGTNTDTITVTITVTNVNEAPVFFNTVILPPCTDIEVNVSEGLEIDDLEENTPADRSIGTIGTTVVARDSDDGDEELTYTLSGPDAGSFDIDGDTGQLKTKTVLNYENPVDNAGTARDNVYEVTVTASDDQGHSSSIKVTITVINVNEAPEFAAETDARSIAEDKPAGENIGIPIVATDPDGTTDADPGTDGNQALTYALGGDSGPFVIESNGQLKVKDADMLDYETRRSYAVTVTADDGSTLSDIIIVTIAIGDANDAPMFLDANLAIPSRLPPPAQSERTRRGV